MKELLKAGKVAVPRRNTLSVPPTQAFPSIPTPKQNNNILPLITTAAPIVGTTPAMFSHSNTVSYDLRPSAQTSNMTIDNSKAEAAPVQSRVLFQGGTGLGFGM